MYASQAEEVDELPFGSVGVILGLKYTRTGDTLVSPGGPASSRSLLRDITPPAAVISASVIPQSHADLEPVQEALESLVRTDPSVRVDTQEGQILVHGLGALHLEIIEGRLKDEWNVRFEFGKRRVSYREGLGDGVSTNEPGVWQTDVGGKQVAVSVTLDIRPLVEGEEGDPVWDGNMVLDRAGKALPAPDSMASKADAYIARGIASALSNSPNTSLAMSHLRVQVKDHNIQPPSTSPSILTGASAVILRNRIRDAGVGPIMEPYALLKISTNEDTIGKVVKDLTEHGGEVLNLGTASVVAADGTEDVGGYSEEGNYIPPQWLSPSGVDSSLGTSRSSYKRSVHALAPLSQMLDYSNRLRSISGGHGLFEMSVTGFRSVSAVRKLEILKEIGRA